MYNIPSMLKIIHMLKIVRARASHAHFISMGAASKLSMRLIGDAMVPDAGKLYSSS